MVNVSEVKILIVYVDCKRETIRANIGKYSIDQGQIVYNISYVIIYIVRPGDVGHVSDSGQGSEN